MRRAPDDYPPPLAPPGRVAPVPRRVRGELAGRTVVDSVAAVYGWEWDHYPVFYIPVTDVEPGLLVSEGRRRAGPLGQVEVHSVGGRTEAASLVVGGGHPELIGTVQIAWDALDAWYEEDERVFVHPRNPYTRVDALRSTRALRIELDGVVLAESSSPVLVFETGLPTRYYLNRTEVDFSQLVPSPTVSACPSKGTTSAYWSVRAAGRVHPDLAWSYDFPTRELLPIAGLVAFYNERVDIVLDGVRLDRPQTHFS